jgi:hypothetical protein
MELAKVVFVFVLFKEVINMVLDIETLNKFQEKQFESGGILDEISVDDITLTKEQLIIMANELHGNHDAEEIKIPKPDD